MTAEFQINKSEAYYGLSLPRETLYFLYSPLSLKNFTIPDLRSRAYGRFVIRLRQEEARTRLSYALAIHRHGERSKSTPPRHAQSQDAQNLPRSAQICQGCAKTSRSPARALFCWQVDWPRLPLIHHLSARPSRPIGMFSINDNV